MIPTPEQAQRRLQQILRRGSVNLGQGPGTERLMLMLTRSCELRCGYCLVDKKEDAPELSRLDARRGIDLLMQSGRPRLEPQFLGGEPRRAGANDRYGLSRLPIRNLRTYPTFIPGSVHNRNLNLFDSDRWLIDP